jgi:Tol biopolymer transport system component
MLRMTVLMSATLLIFTTAGGCDGRALDTSGQGGATGGETMTGEAGTSGSAGTSGGAGTTGSAGDSGSSGIGGTSDIAGTTGTTGIAGNTGTGGSPQNIPACGSSLPAIGATGTIAFDSDRETFNRDIYTIRVDGSALTRLTTHLGIDKEPAFSPDGNRISFTSDRSGKLQIHLIDLATMQVTQLTDVADGADQSSFSRDGSRVAFHSGASVWVIGADGTGLTRVATGLDSFNAYFWPAFSADGSELLFDRNNEINAVHLDGTGFRRIVQNWTTTIKAPAVSPNGVDVAYHVYCDSNGPSIWTTPFSTTTNPCEGRRVTPLGEPESLRPAWGPNNLIAYARVEKGTNVASIAVVSRAGGSSPCALTADYADDRNPSWSF